MEEMGREIDILACMDMEAVVALENCWLYGSRLVARAQAPLKIRGCLSGLRCSGGFASDGWIG